MIIEGYQDQALRGGGWRRNEQSSQICDVYETIARGDTLRLCNAFRPNWTKSWGRNCSGGFSECLVATGSNLGDEKFSLSSSDMAELENRSLEK